MQLKLADSQFLQVRQLAPELAIAQMAAHLEKFASVVNIQVSVGYAPITAAATIQVGNSIQFIEGAGTIDTIQVAEGWIGILCLIAVDGFDLVTGGNIMAAVTAAAGTATLLVWEGRNWYPVI